MSEAPESSAPIYVRDLTVEQFKALLAEHTAPAAPVIPDRPTLSNREARLFCGFNGDWAWRAFRRRTRLHKVGPNTFSTADCVRAMQRAAEGKIVK